MYIRNKPIIQILVVGITLMFILAACSTPEQPELPLLTMREDRLSEPPTPDTPSQADLGAHVYYQVCMACHGDMGQGLTDEWRDVWSEDRNCWKSKCHAANHPPQGFAIEKTCCPEVLGYDVLLGFDNAQELFTYNSESMPWWSPGYLTKEEYWQVTAFMMRSQGVLPDDVTLNEGNAFAFNIRPTSPLPRDHKPDVLFVSGVLTLVAGLLIIQRRISK